MNQTTLILALALAIVPVVGAAQNVNAVPPNAPEQRPALKNQTRAPILDTSV